MKENSRKNESLLGPFKGLRYYIVNEKNGWLTLGAYGFTFSTPTVRVKLTQEVVKPVVLKKTTITCVKGKIVKKVTATNPLCPKGYKKK